MKKRLLYALGIILLISVASLFIDFHYGVKKVLAQYSWYDSLKVYENITTINSAIRNITNTYGFSIDVRVYVVNVTNEDKISLYKTTANGTDFIIIENGETTRSENTYISLQPAEILFFDISAKPKTDGNITVEKRVELIKSEIVVVPPPPLPPPAIQKYTLIIHVIDLFSMNAPNLKVVIKDSKGATITELLTHADGKTDPTTLAKGTYTIEVYKDNKFQISKTIYLAEETTIVMQIGIPVILTFTRLIIILLIAIVIILFIIILKRKKEHK